MSRDARLSLFAKSTKNFFLRTFVLLRLFICRYFMVQCSIYILAHVLYWICISTYSQSIIHTQFVNQFCSQLSSTTKIFNFFLQIAQSCSKSFLNMSNAFFFSNSKITVRLGILNWILYVCLSPSSM